MSAPAVVNGRFLTMQSTGVQRYARELLRHLPAHVDRDVVVAVPPGRLIDGCDEEGLNSVRVSSRWHGLRGHTWEQTVLPGVVRRAGRSIVLLSPANWGPVLVGRQVVVIQDIAPHLHPELFAGNYRAVSSALMPLLVRRSARVVVSSSAVRGDLCNKYGADPDRIDIIPPGVGAPFDRWPVDDLAERPGAYCLMVGGHDRRKNVAWVLGWWPTVHDELGLELVVTTRGRATARFSDAIVETPGVTVRVDPSDEELAALYSGALCLLWPSIYEGYGLPLLEAMAVGTPFLATDTGAAKSLAVEPTQVLALEANEWIDQLRQWRLDGLGSLRARSVATARALSWDAASRAVAMALAKVIT